MQCIPPAPPVEGRVRRGGLLSLPVLNPDRLRTAKALVEKAVKLRRVFSVRGPYPVIRAALRARGWVERRLHRSSQTQARCYGDEDADGDESDDSGNDGERGEDVEKEDDPDYMYNLMSRMVRNETTYFYWTTRRDDIDCRSLKKEQMTNHYAKAGTFTTKVGLCVNLRSLQWFDSVDPDTFFPRCYRLGAEDEKQAFIEDFRRTACTSLLQFVVERSGVGGLGGGVERSGGGGLGGGGDISQQDNIPENIQGRRKASRSRPGRVVSSGMINIALLVCQEFLNSCDHSDIDVAMETTPRLTEQQWEEFLRDYYLVVHEGAVLEGGNVYAERCQVMLASLLEICPQLDTDGLHNIWIIKPGAQSRGRGIMCMNRLEEMLKLVTRDCSLMKESKWVVQKYLERPLLVHGTKFDLRQWFLVTDWNPLTVWFYRECYLRFSTQPYSTHTLDSSVHLCNNSIQKHYQPSQLRHPEVPEDNMWSCSEFRAFLGVQGRGSSWGAVVVPGMQRAVVHALQTAQDLVEARKGSFELYGADFMLGRDLRPWLLEINASPTMAPTTTVTARLCPAVQLDALRVVLDRRTDPGAYTGGFQLIYKQAAVEVPQYVGVNLLVEGASLKRPRPAARPPAPHIPLPHRPPVPHNPPPHKAPPSPHKPPPPHPNSLPHRAPPRSHKTLGNNPLLSLNTQSNQPSSVEACTLDKPSNHTTAPHSCPHPVGKENNLEASTKKRQPTVEPEHRKEHESRTLGRRQHTTSGLVSSCRRVPERPPVVHIEPQKRACGLGLSQSNSGPLCLLPRALSYSHTAPNIQPVLQQAPQTRFQPPPPRISRTFFPDPVPGLRPRRAPPRDLPTLHGSIPCLEVFSLRPPGVPLESLSIRPCPALSSLPGAVVRMHQSLPYFHRQAVTKGDNNNIGGATSFE